MKIDTSRLKGDTLVDICQNVYPDSECNVLNVQAYGASKRNEYTILDKNGVRLGATAFNSLDAWRYAVDNILKG